MLAEQYEAFLLDLDGVVYLGTQPLAGAVLALRRLREMGKQVRFLTNDPRPTRVKIVQRLQAMGVMARHEDIISAGWATASFLRQSDLSSVYLLGSSGLRTELEEQGIRVLEQGVVQAVVVGYDEDISYREIQQAVRFLEGGARFIATNADQRFPTPEGTALAAGTLVAAVQAGSDLRPLVIGKPGKAMFHLALQTLPPQGRAVMIGDNPATDILGAHECGLEAILIASQPPHFPSTRDFRQADMTIPDLSSLFQEGLSVRPWLPQSFAWPERVEAGVAAIIFDNETRVLLGRRADNGLWGLPSGHVEPGETVAEAVVREVYEETGLGVQVERLIGLYSDPVSQVFSYPSGLSSQFITSCFLCRYINGKLRCDEREVLELAFFPLRALPEQLLTMHPQWLADALSEAERAFIR
ncbi:HAD-IIA family hydrolase [Ktedonosporobacter rubrisoli]|uniref:HAD-IIA family hydrolase n=1 Tax=Ktedonosporobacter rubrisoli TaxID=2509675 RepID=A0A4V0YZU4_KTERU|nr:HAD-IIA family hydrolase [Ktedonosporobacter rubrisoli]QBD80931.1 HAD-IIA family hydrolase [Ktedonosporobacter rubrisoli]